MNNAELILALRYCGGDGVILCEDCPIYEECNGRGSTFALNAAADEIEAQQKALDECAKQLADMAAKLPKEGECEAKKPKTVKDTEYSFYCDCPTCGGRLISNVGGEWCAGSFDRFCRMCGQKIDWSEYCGWSNKPCGTRMKGEQE